MKYSDKQRVKKIYENALALWEYVAGRPIRREELLTQKPLQWLVTTPLYNMGEHAYYLSPQYKADHDEIPWLMIAGLRHRLVHDYEGTNWNIIAGVVFDELPPLIEKLAKLCNGPHN